MTIKSLNPATEEVNKEMEALTDQQALDACKAAKLASRGWNDIGLDARLSYIKKLATVLRENKTEYAKLATLEMGRVLKDGEIEIERCAALCDMYVQNAAAWLHEEPV
ncbi:MAG: aldehyde dehydrogenase family protein, partial [Candidatus Micrarchaeota archaeon]|nr:aldehyde dehydrogenase family protein [Candidatus Micrarchaeota archaeon]